MFSLQCFMDLSGNNMNMDEFMKLFRTVCMLSMSGEQCVTSLHQDVGHCLMTASAGPKFCL